MKVKIVFGVLGVLVVLLVAAALIVGTRLGRLVKAAMEEVGPKITQTTLTVDAVGGGVDKLKQGLGGLFGK